MRTRTGPVAAIGAIAAALAAVSCGVTVDVTISVPVGELRTYDAPQQVGYVQGYVFTPTRSTAADRQARTAIVSQTPTPPEGYAVPTSSVAVTVEGTGWGPRRLDANGFFIFSGFPPDAPPAQVRIEFPGGGYADVLAEVPVSPYTIEGYGMSQVDLENNSQYRSNARDIRAVSSCRMNLDVSTSQGGRIRLMVSGRGDLRADTVQGSDEAYLLVEYALQAGQSRTLRDVKPISEQALCRLATPKAGKQMFFLYLLAEESLNPSNGVESAVTGLEFIFTARVGAPL